MICALCGRTMRQAAVTIGAMSVGPKCARRAGLVEIGRRRMGFVRLVKQSQTERDPRTPDLFESMES